MASCPPNGGRCSGTILIPSNLPTVVGGAMASEELCVLISRPWESATFQGKGELSLEMELGLFISWP